RDKGCLGLHYRKVDVVKPEDNLQPNLDVEIVKLAVACISSQQLVAVDSSAQ
nr:hypothetical protein [Tanacetum cinerariifolium]